MNAYITTALIWWLKHQTLPYRRRAIERILRAFGASRSYALQVSSNLN